MEVTDRVAKRVMYSQSLSSQAPIWIVGADGLSDTMTLDFNVGGAWSVAGGLRLDGGAGGDDRMAACLAISTS